MGYRTVVIKNGEHLSLRLDNLVIRKQGNEYVIALSDIETVILEGLETVITTRVLAKLSEYHISVVVCDQKYHPAGIFLGVGQYHHTAKRSIWQSKWDEHIKDIAWTHVIRQKMFGQFDVAAWFGVEEERLKLMEDLINSLEIGDITNREGHMAKVYFNSLFGKDFSRNSPLFENACLNYGYSIIRAQISRSLVASGLNPSLGIHHKNEFNAFNLVDDLMEPFRPLMDWYVIEKIPVTEDNYLTYEIRLQLIEFLNQPIKIQNRRLFMNHAINEYISSFINCMDEKDFAEFVEIKLSNFTSEVRK